MDIRPDSRIKAEMKDLKDKNKEAALAKIQGFKEEKYVCKCGMSHEKIGDCLVHVRLVDPHTFEMRPDTTKMKIADLFWNFPTMTDDQFRDSTCRANIRLFLQHLW